MLNICSLGLTLIVLSGLETEDRDFNEGADNTTFEDEVFHGQSMRELLTDELLHAPTLNELLTFERVADISRAGCSVFDNSADVDYIRGDSHISFDDETDEGGNNTIKDNSNRIIRQDTNTDEQDNSISGNDDNLMIKRNIPTLSSRISNNNAVEIDDTGKNVDDSDSDSDSDSDGNADGDNADASSDIFKDDYDQIS